MLDATGGLPPAGELALLITAAGGLAAGIVAGMRAWSERKTPTRTVAVAEVEAALTVLGTTIDRLEREGQRLAQENRLLHEENEQFRRTVAELRNEVERLRRLIEGIPQP